MYTFKFARPCPSRHSPGTVAYETVQDFVVADSDEEAVAKAEARLATQTIVLKGVRYQAYQLIV
jgi:hypothetical protein